MVFSEFVDIRQQPIRSISGSFSTNQLPACIQVPSGSASLNYLRPGTLRNITMHGHFKPVHGNTFNIDVIRRPWYANVNKETNHGHEMSMVSTMSMQFHTGVSFYKNDW